MTKVGDLLAEFKELPAAGAHLPVLTLTERNGFVRQEERFKKRLALDDTSNYKVVRRGDLAFNPYLLWAGAVAQNTIVDAGVISPLYPTFRVREGFYPPYVARLLLTDQLISAYDGIAFGSVPRRRRSSVNDFLSLDLPPQPPLAEQRRIAAILDAADGIRAKRRAQLAHLDALPQAVFREIFGAPTSFQAKPLGEIATLTAGKSLVGEDLDAAAAFRVLKISAVTSGLYRPGESKPLPMGYVPPEEHIVRAGDLLMSRANTADLVGATALVVETPQYLALPDKIWRFVWRGSEIEPVYLHAFLSSAVARRKLSAMASGSGGSMKNISKAKLNRLDVPVPPLALQQEFVAKVEAIHAERARVARALEADDELFAALQHRAFRGEL